jgi:hypothetical protein
VSDDEIFEPEALAPDEAPASEGEEQSSEADPEEFELEEGENEGEEEESQDGDDDGDEDGDDADELELDEFEYEGKTFKVPSEVKSKLARLDSMDADYTQKSQANAEVKKELLQQRETLQQQAQIQQALAADYADLHSVGKDLAQYQNVNWDQYEAQSPQDAQQHWRRYQQLKETYQQKAGVIQQKQHQATATIQRQEAERYQKFQNALTEKFSDWSDQVGTELTQFVGRYNIQPEDVSRIREVGYVELIRDAKAYHDLKAKLDSQQAKAKTRKPKPGAKPLAKPSAKGRGPARKGLDDSMSAEAWAAKRNEEIRRKRGF